MDFFPELIIKITIVLGFIFGMLFLLRRKSAALRHWMISLSMITLIILPLLSVLLPNWKLRILPPESTAVHTDAYPELNRPITQLSSGVDPGLAEKSTLKRPGQDASDPSINTVLPAPVTSDSFSFSRTTLLFIIWLSGCCWMLIRMVLGLMQLKKLKKASLPFPLIDELDLSPFSTKTNRPDQLCILSHKDVQTPITWSGKNPVILLPAKAIQWSTEELKIILLHELIHIQRKDFLLHLFSLLAVSLYWFHPLVWLLKKQQILEREKACDEAVVRMGVSPVDYAEKLLSVARRMVPPTIHRAGLAIQMAQPSLIKKRIVALLNAPADRRPWSPVRQVAVIMGFVFVLPFLAAVNPVSRQSIQHFLIPPSAPGTTIRPLTSGGLENDKIFSVNASQSQLENKAQKTLPEDRLREEPDPIPVIPPIALAPFSMLPDPEVDEVANMKLKVKGFQTGSRSQNEEGLYGSWANGRSHFRVWIKGAFRILPIMPYIEVETADDLVVIEEKSGNKTYRLVISRAPYDGGLIQSYIGDQPNSWSSISESDELYLWTVNDEWVFLSKGMERWMRRNLDRIAEKLQNENASVWQKVNHQHAAWYNLIRSQEAFRAERFVSATALPDRSRENGSWIDQSSPPKPLFVLADLPDGPVHGFSGANNVEIKTIGSTLATRTTTGWLGGDHRGLRYGVLIDRGDVSGQLVDVNFHLRFNFCKNADLKLQLYGVKDGKPAYSLHSESILIKTGEQTGWISKNLRPYTIGIGDDITLLDKLRKQG